jgi:hypothetical protein
MNHKTAMFVGACALLSACHNGDNVHPDGAQPQADASHPLGDAPHQDAPQDSTATGSDGSVSTEAGLILHYAFEDTGTTVTDTSGLGKNGTLTDATAWTENGRIGRALQMTGDNPATKYVSLPDGVLTGVTDFSISFWVKLNSVAAWARIYDFGNGQTDPANRFMYFSVNGYIGANHGVMASSYGGAPTNENALTSQTQLPTGVWKHVVITGHDGDRTIYIDGFPAVSVTGGPIVAPQEMEPLSPQSWLGKSRFPDPGLDGTLDEFKIYNRVLTTSEIQDLAWPKHDYSYWRFDETTGTTAADSSDNAIPTAIANGVTWTTGRLGGAVDFPGGPGDAAGPTVTLGTNPLAACTNQLTVSVWVKLHTLTPWSRIFDFGNGNTSFIYLAPTDGAGVHFAMVSPSGVFDLVSSTQPLAAGNTWHHVAVTVDTASLATIYVDGNAIGSATTHVPVSDFANVTDLWLGKSRFPDPYLNGSLDELRIGCRALTADEIKNLANAQ